MQKVNAPFFAIGIPTRNRPHQLQKTLSSILQLVETPQELFVCDSSDFEFQEDVTNVCNNSEIKTTLIRSTRPSIPFQRNCIAKAFLESKSEIDFILFLDDDTEPATDYFQCLVDFLMRNPKYGGASGVSQTEQRSKTLDTIGKAFLVSGKQGHVLRSGVGIPPSRTSSSDVDWLFGCSVWRKSVIETVTWNENWDGYAVGDDVEFSFRVSKHWKLRVLPEAQIFHSYASENRPTSYSLARSTVIHRWHIAQLHDKSISISRACVIWSILGEVGFSLIKLLIRPTVSQIKAILGFFVGLIVIIFNPSRP